MVVKYRVRERTFKSGRKEYTVESMSGCDTDWDTIGRIFSSDKAAIEWINDRIQTGSIIIHEDEHEI